MALRGLYVITPGVREGRVLADDVAAALQGGARIVQYRDKGSDDGRKLAEVRRLRALCDDAGALLIVNDDLGLAADGAADGVHLGRGDATIAAARIVLGAMAVIGVSCYDSIERARDAEADGADYVAFGSFFDSPTKPDAVRAPAGLIERAKAELGCPVCAVGGITPGNGGELVAAGADMLAAVSGVFDTDDVEAASRRYAALF